MRWSLLALGLALSLATSAARAQCLVGTVERDQERIRTHLSLVEHILRAAPIDHLTEAQRTARGRNLDRLHAYWVRGVFPRSTPDQPSPLVPTFIDTGGRACAMAYLVIESGHRDVAEEIARTENFARIAEIRHPALGPWLEANGMTAEEAAMVQPSAYVCPPCVDAGEPIVCVWTWDGDGGVWQTPVERCHDPGCAFGSTAPLAVCDDGGSCTCPWDAGPPPPDAPATDAGLDAPRPFDAGRPDAGRRDAGMRDAGLDAAYEPPHVVTYGCHAARGGAGVGSSLVALVLAWLVRRRMAR